MSDEQAKKAPQSKRDDDPRADHNPVGAADGSDSMKEIGGRPGPDPTRFGDWEKDGRCIDF